MTAPADGSQRVTDTPHGGGRDVTTARPAKTSAAAVFALVFGLGAVLRPDRDLVTGRGRVRRPGPDPGRRGPEDGQQAGVTGKALRSAAWSRRWSASSWAG